MPMNYINIIIVLNIISALFFISDKSKAVHQRQRIPENTLFLVSLLAPFGSYIGMIGANHKTKKPMFSIGVPLVICIHIVSLIYFR